MDSSGIRARPYPFYLGIGFALIRYSQQLVLSVKDTEHHVAIEAAELQKAPLRHVFWDTTWKKSGRHHPVGLATTSTTAWFGAYCLCWYPKHFSLEEIGKIVALYPSSGLGNYLKLVNLTISTKENAVLGHAAGLRAIADDFRFHFSPIRHPIYPSRASAPPLFIPPSWLPSPIMPPQQRAGDQGSACGGTWKLCYRRLLAGMVDALIALIGGLTIILPWAIRSDRNDHAGFSGGQTTEP